jgi:hypothetical protein
LPSNHHHPPRTSVLVTTVPLPGQIVRNLTFQDNRLPSSSQRTRETFPPDAEYSHHVSRRPAVDRGASLGTTRHPHIL